MASATVRVEKATSDLLLSPDWALNMDICDSVNSDYGQAKDVIKTIKKRLHHKTSRVQFLTLTLLETLMKNCGDYVHQQVQEREILNEMVKIVKKKPDTQVRDKILLLIESWQEAFGGPTGKYPQYYWAYSELKAYGVIFPERTYDDAPIITPPATQYPTPTAALEDHPSVTHFPVPAPPRVLYSIPSTQQPPNYANYANYAYGSPRAAYGPQPLYGMPVNTHPHPHPHGPHPHPHPPSYSYGMPVNASLRLDEAMASEMANLSLADLDSMRSVMELLNEMLRAVNPSDCAEAVKDEVISDLVSQCRLNEKKLMACINSTSDEKILEESLELNDKLQGLLAKHDAIIASIASGSASMGSGSAPAPPLATEMTNAIASGSTSQITNAAAAAAAAPVEDDDDDDEFAQLARRKPKMIVPEASTSVLSNPISLRDPPLPAPVKTSSTSRDDDNIMNLLSLSLAPPSSSPLPPQSSPPFAPTTPTLTHFSPSNQNQNQNQNPSPLNSQGDDYYSISSWVVPPQPQPEESSEVSTSYPPPPWEIDTPADLDSVSTSPSHAMRPLQQQRPNVLGAQPTPSYVSSNTFFAELLHFPNADATVTTSTASPTYSINSATK